MGITEEQAASGIHAGPRKTHGTAIAVVAALAILEAGLVGYVLRGCAYSPAGQGTSDKVMQAWATGDSKDIAAAYDLSVVMIFDGNELASNRDEITSVIRDALALPNTYERIGPVSRYVASNGDQYVASLVEVVGPAHPDGVALIGFYRVHDGKVIRHVFMDAEQY